MSQHPADVSTLYPPDIRDALVSAGQRKDIKSIDALTDQLAVRGYVRPRHADDMPAKVWA